MVMVHIVSVVIGLAVSGAILVQAKGTGTHRRLGWVYAVALAATAVASFWIYEVRDGAPSVFHGVSVLVALVIAAGIVAIRRGHVWLHVLLMTTSVLMTVITGIAQFFDQLPLPNAALNAIVFLQIPSIVGFTLIWRAAAGQRAAA